MGILFKKVFTSRIEKLQAELNHVTELRDDFPKETFFWAHANLSIETLKMRIVFWETLLGYLGGGQCPKQA